MRVLQINSVCGTGSTGRIALNIHNYLLENGHESWIAYGRGEADACPSFIRIGNTLDNYIHVANTRLLDRHGFSSTKATMHFLNTIDEIKPDIIHLHNLHGYYINIEILFDYLKKRNIPTIWTLHDCWGFTGHCAYFDFVNCEKWKTQCNSCPQKKEYPASWLIDNSIRNYSDKRRIFTSVNNLTIVTPSIWLKELVKRSFLSVHDTRVINNGIDLSTFIPVSSSIRTRYKIGSKFMILAVANIWEDRKGFKSYIQLAKYLNIDEIIVMVGLSKKQIDSLPDNIIGIEKTTDIKELVELYSASDLLLNLTEEDNYPTVNLEAAACGTFVLTKNTGGCAETIRDGFGQVIQGNEIEDIYDAIQNVKKAKIVNRLREDMDSKYSAKQYVSLYENRISS